MESLWPHNQLTPSRRGEAPRRISLELYYAYFASKVYDGREVDSMIILASGLIAVIGGIAYHKASNPRAAELGRLAYLVGTWIFLLQLPENAFKLLQ
jgi:hypothetical protein